MLNSAYISFLVDSGGGQDVNFDPIPTTNTPQDYVSCNLKEVRKEWKFDVNGEHIQAKYSIYIENSIIPSTVDITLTTQVILKDLNEVVLGTFRVLSSEPLSIIQSTKIIVA